MRNSLLEIKDKTFEASINTSSISKKDIKSKTANISDKKTLSVLIKFIKKFYVIIKNQKTITISMENENQDMKNVFENLLECIIDVLELEKQELVKKSIYDSDIDTDSKGSYQFDAELRKQIDNIFDASSNWEPKTQDINQGQLADCGLLSALLGIIKTDKNAIKECFWGQTKNTIKFRFFKVKIDIKSQKDSKPSGYKASPNGKVIIEVQKSILKSFGNEIIGNSTDALWVNMFEKAFMVYKATDGYVTSDDNYCQKNIIDNWKNKNPGKKISISNLEWGYGFIFLTAITGKCAVSRNTPKIEGKKFPEFNSSDKTKRDYDKSAEDLYNYFDKTLKNKKTIVVCSRDNSIPDGLTKSVWLRKVTGDLKDYPGLVKRHAYAMVDSVNEDSEHYKYITLQNPHIEEDVDYKKETTGKIVVSRTKKPRIVREKNMSNKNGRLVIELNDFIKYFGSYEVCHKKNK